MFFSSFFFHLFMNNNFIIMFCQISIVFCRHRGKAATTTAKERGKTNYLLYSLFCYIQSRLKKTESNIAKKKGFTSFFFLIEDNCSLFCQPPS